MREATPRERDVFTPKNISSTVFPDSNNKEEEAFHTPGGKMPSPPVHHPLVAACGLHQIRDDQREATSRLPEQHRMDSPREIPPTKHKGNGESVQNAHRN